MTGTQQVSIILYDPRTHLIQHHLEISGKETKKRIDQMVQEFKTERGYAPNRLMLRNDDEARLLEPTEDIPGPLLKAAGGK
jgi:hypothetical protein